MKVFTTENETNNITVHATVQGAEGTPNADRFRNEAGLAELVADWPAARLTEVWNSIPGLTPVTRFKDRKTAVSRIWKTIQNLGTDTVAAEPETASPVPAEPPQVAPQAAHVAPAETPASKRPPARRRRPKPP